MRIRFLRPYRGRLTRELPIAEGAVVEYPSATANALIQEGAAVLFESQQEPSSPSPLVPYVPLPSTPDTHRVVAAMTCYNDILGIDYAIQRATSQGIELVVIDNWSDDGTWEFLQSLDNPRVLSVCRYPDQPQDQFSFPHLHIKLKEIFDAYPDCWRMWHASDESVLSPWIDVPYRDALWIVEQQGYNAVDHHYLDFTMTTDHQMMEPGDMVTAMPYYRLRELSLVRTWKTEEEFSLHMVGHDVEYPSKRVYPDKFILRNYRFLSETHAAKKVNERKTKLATSMRENGHAEDYYVTDISSLVKLPTALLAWNSNEWITPLPDHLKPKDDTNGNHKSREVPASGVGTTSSDTTGKTARRTRHGRSNPDR